MNPVETVASILEEYANRGVFRAFSRMPDRGGKAIFRMMWHRDRLFELVLDPAKSTLRFPLVLPQVPAKSSMYQEFQEYVEARHSPELPGHRRIDPEKAQASPGNRAGAVSLTMTSCDGDYTYATRKLINLVHEVFLDFLNDGRYYDYMIEKFDLDPDHL